MGTQSVRYDTLRYDSPSDLTTPIFIETEDALDAEADDLGIPVPGEGFYYLIRAVNDCPQGHGPLGYRSDGAERSVP